MKQKLQQLLQQQQQNSLIEDVTLSLNDPILLDISAGPKYHMSRTNYSKQSLDWLEW